LTLLGAIRLPVSSAVASSLPVSILAFTILELVWLSTETDGRKGRSSSLKKSYSAARTSGHVSLSSTHAYKPGLDLMQATSVFIDFRPCDRSTWDYTKSLFYMASALVGSIGGISLFLHLVCR